jgi:hypothetical protein
MKGQGSALDPLGPPAALGPRPQFCLPVRAAIVAARRRSLIPKGYARRNRATARLT